MQTAGTGFKQHVSHRFQWAQKRKQAWETVYMGPFTGTLVYSIVIQPNVAMFQFDCNLQGKLKTRPKICISSLSKQQSGVWTPRGMMLMALKCAKILKTTMFEDMYQ